MNRCKLVFYTGIPHSGVTFLFSVLEKNPYMSTLMLSDDFFVYLATKESLIATRQKGISVYYDIINRLSKKPNFSYPVDKVLSVVLEISKFICKQDDFFKNFCKLISKKESLTIYDSIVAVFKAKMLSQGKSIDDNIVPVFFFDSHSRVNAAIKHKSIINTFENVSFLTSFRNPLYTTASSIKKGYYIDKTVTYNLMRLNFFGFVQDFSSQWKEKCYVILFEEAKLFPERTFCAFCDVFDVPYSNEMLTANDEGPTCRGYAIRGFDTEPVTRKLDDVFSEKDMMYLSYVYRKVMNKYGYTIPSGTNNIIDDEMVCSDLFQNAYDKNLIVYDKNDFLKTLIKLEKYGDSLLDNHFFPYKISANNSYEN